MGKQLWNGGVTTSENLHKIKLAKIVKINFFFLELWELTKDLQQFKEHLFKKKQLNLSERATSFAVF